MSCHSKTLIIGHDRRSIILVLFQKKIDQILWPAQIQGKTLFLIIKTFMLKFKTPFFCPWIPSVQIGLKANQLTNPNYSGQPKSLCTDRVKSGTLNCLAFQPMLTLTKIQKPQLDLSINLQPISFSAQLEYENLWLHLLSPAKCWWQGNYLTVIKLLWNNNYFITFL